ncbi:MAG: fibro-slime domain-containing protein [Eubacteriaceae bacterium]|nr:fibro-slime domain-containing protein [Eubacteriaceae bacterium]
MKNKKLIKGAVSKFICLLLALTLVFSYTAPVFAQEAAGAQANQQAGQTDATVQTAADTTEGASRSVAQENGVEVVRFDYQSADVNVLVTLKDPADLPENAVLSVTPVTLDAAAQAKVDEKVKSENRTITTQKAFDIKFTVDGKEVEPGDTVKVTMSLPEVTAHTQTEVLHLSDDSKSVENTGAEKVSGNKLQLETDSFSRYVVINFGEKSAELTIERYVITDENPNGKLTYKSSKTIDGVSEEGEIQQVVTYDLNNYDCQKIIKVEDSKEEEISLSSNGKINIGVQSDTTLKLYYKAKEGSSTDPVTFFDYDVDYNHPETLINDPDNYPAGTTNDQKIAVSTKLSGTYKGKSTGGPEVTKTPVWDGMPVDPVKIVDSRNVNEFSGMCYDPAKTNTTKGMLNLENGLKDFSQSQTDGTIEKGEPNWGLNSADQQLYDPGLFTEDNKEGKHVLTNFQLKFEQDGDHYHLADVVQQNGTTAFKNHQNDGGTNGYTYNSKEGYNFFPLDDKQIIGYDYKGSEQTTSPTGDRNYHNHYFGMRYDITFKLGDYVGDLNYKFRGDDDMWVILDGKKVVIDLGGIHSAADGKIDLWKVLAQQNGVDYKDENALNAFIQNESEKRTDAVNNQYHCLTILYMERGGGRSNCVMDFTIPNMEIAEVVKSPKGEFTFDKKQISIDEKTEAQSITPLAGAEFSIKKLGEATPMAYSTSDANGKVNFNNLTAGTDSQVYVIQEEKAPTGYAASSKTYYVKATLNEAADTVTIEGLYKDEACTEPLKAKEDLDQFKGAVGYNDVKDNTVINYPIDAYLKQKKSASLVNWDNRTYRIDLYIGQQIPRLKKIDDAVVTDIVDSRFDVTDANGTPLEKGDKINDEGGKDENGSGIISFYTDNYGNTCYQVTWNDQSIPALTDDNGNNLDDVTLSGWHKKINIKAKTEYVGGNNVTTNVAPYSAVTVSGMRYSFEQPTVNVKPQLKISNITRTYFAGEAIDHDANTGGMFNLTTNGSHEGTPQCDVIGGKYQAIDTSENAHFSKTWYSDQALETQANLPQKETASVDSPAEVKRYLMAKYTFDEPTDDSLKATSDKQRMHYAGEENHGYFDGDAYVLKEGVQENDELYVDAVNTGALNRNDVMLPNGASAYQNKNYGVYTVHVVKGQIQITKKIDNQYSGTKAIKANQTFVYRIDVYKNINGEGLPTGSPEQTIYETIAFSANENVTEKTKLISNLPKGVYVVTEETKWSPKYQLDKAEGSSQYANLGNDANNGVRLIVGKETAKNLNTGMRTFSGLEQFKYQNGRRDQITEINIDGGQKYRDIAGYEEAKASFVNKTDSTWQWLSDTAAAVNMFTK